MKYQCNWNNKKLWDLNSPLTTKKGESLCIFLQNYVFAVQSKVISDLKTSFVVETIYGFCTNAITLRIWWP